MALSYNTSLTNVVTHYLQRLNVPFSTSALAEKLRENPYYPSLYSIKYVLDRYNIPNEAFSLQQEHWKELEPPFITYARNTNAGKDFVLVTAIKNETVSYIHGKQKPVTVTEAAFLADWEKMVLVAEPASGSGDPELAANRRKEHTRRKQQFLLVAGLALLVMLFVISPIVSGTNGLALPFLLMTLTKIAGMVITGLLLLYEADKSITIVRNLCGGGIETHCDAVLNSPAAGIAGLRWSEAGFFYFASSGLFLLFPSLSLPAKLPWLAGTATLVAAYIPFSIYYQYRIVRQWCPLCLTVQAVLYLELTWSLIVFWPDPFFPSLSAPFLVTALSCLLLPIIAWYFFKPFLQAKLQKDQYEAAYKRLLYNPEQFKQLLVQQHKAPDGWEQLGIMIGNPSAENTIVKVCNPYCAPCASAHPELEKLIRTNKRVNLKIIFTATTKQHDRSAQPAKHLLAIAAQADPVKTMEALDNWYSASRKDYEAFAAKYPVNGALPAQDKKIEAMDQWCRLAGIAATPTIFINGYQLPENYDINELKYIL